jgi:uncharacterized membrane protein
LSVSLSQVAVSRWWAVLPLAGGALAMRVAGRPELATLLGMAALAVAIGQRLGFWARLALAVGIGVLAGGCWLWPDGMAMLARLLPSLGDLLMAAHFGATLLPGREPLISYYTRHDPGVRGPECAGYTRGLTLLWALVFLALALLHAVLLLGSPLNTLPVLAATTAAMALLFLGEHIVRTLNFPQFGIATPVRTLRAILKATTARHA